MKFLSALTKKDLQNKICLVRVDLNIKDTDLRSTKSPKPPAYRQAGPFGKGAIHPRISAVLPTIKFLLSNGAKVVLLSHRGRPESVKSEKLKVKSYSLKPFVKIFEKLLKEKIEFADFWIPGIQKFYDSRNPKICLLENLRFNTGEETNNPKFAKKLASLGDIYINDAFAVSHRANASVEAITEFIPSYAGLLLEKEISNLDKVALQTPAYRQAGPFRKGARGIKPFVIILGGAKISDKIGVIENFKSKADFILIGGGIANNCLKAQGLPIGDSICEDSKIEFSKKLIKNKKIILPVDFIIENRKILDIGPQTVKKYSQIIKGAKTIIWNGPMGYFENPKFKKGSDGIAQAILKSHAFAVIGGGETSALFVKSKKLKVKSNVFISTGGGAMLEYLSNKKMPGIEALNRTKL